MRIVIYAAAIIIGVAIGLAGSEPLWVPAVAALLSFPFAAAAAARPRRYGGGRGRHAPMLPASVTALTGALLAALALRLAVDAPSWLSGPAADCGAPSTSTQQVVLWAAAVVFAAASVPVVVTLLNVGRRLHGRRSSNLPAPPLSLYPVAVAAAALALTAASFATTC
ncbi:MAG: hypothetical protein H0V25_11715 [Solirubrobacterales bacterium]|nr:hypothetical protein [Solirubrobacterales bacterium]